MQSRKNLIKITSSSRRGFLKRTGIMTLGAANSAFVGQGSAQPAGALGQTKPVTAQPTPLYCFDFGHDYRVAARGFQPASSVYRSPRYLWITPVRQQERIGETDPLLKTFVEGPQGEFWVGLDNGDYSVKLIMGDREKGHGPFTIYLQGQAVKSGLRLGAGEVLRPSFPAKVVDNKLRLRFEAAPGETFLLNGLIIEGPPGKAAHRMFENAPEDHLPTVEEVLREGSVDTRATLRRYCDWLLAQRFPNGFLGDRGNYGIGPPVDDYWYTTAYPVRTLLAGYEILSEKKYLDATAEILDEFVGEQLPNGAWNQTVRNKPTRELSKEELDECLQKKWMNMSDIGSMAAALGIACHYVPQPRKSIYLASLRHFCDDWASQWQLVSGGFTDGMHTGVPQTQIYSAATGIEAAAFAAHYAVTKETKYLKTAQRAAEFLLDNWTPDGPSFTYPYDVSQIEGKKYLQPVTNFGYLFYDFEGILMTYHQSEDPAFRAKVEKVCKWYLKGERGLLETVGYTPWMPLRNFWDNSKSAGMPLVFLDYQRMESDPAIDRLVGLATRFLCTPKFAERIGVMVNDPDLPWGGHSLQSWAGFAVAATGFAGLSVAEMIQPGVIYLTKNKD